MELEKVKRASNYGKHVEWVVRTYEEAKGLVHGFQKDAIQNAIGARKQTKSYAGWKCVIDIKETDKGTFLIVEDFGTVGLTGKNYTIEDLDQMTENSGYRIPSDQRLARISVDNSSGGDATSAGLYGVGKTLYVAASKITKNYFESVTENEGYRCNVNDNNKMFRKALEEDEGRNFIKEATGLEPIDHVGTRFIVVEPKEEIVEAIRGAQQEMLHDAEETWWRSIVKMSNPEDGIFIGGVRAEVPECYRFNEDKSLCDKETLYIKEPTEVEEGYRFTKFGFFIKEEIPEDLQGFYFYRRGMKIGKIDISKWDILIKKPYFGFIELDDRWEEELAETENATHYDVMANSKRRNCYQLLKATVLNKIQDFLEEFGYLSIKENNEKYLAQLAEDIKQDISDLLSENGFESVGTGNRKQRIEVSFDGVRYPHEGNPLYERSIYQSEKISGSYIIKNNTLRKIDLKVSLYTTRSNGAKISDLEEFEVSVGSKEQKECNFALIADDSNSAFNECNNLKISVALKDDNSKPVVKKLVYYYGTETIIKAEEDFEFNIASYRYPNEPEKGRRVDTNESITGLSYTMVNRLHRPVKARLKVMTQDVKNNNELIETVMDQCFTLPPDGNELVTDPIDIVFSEATYFPKLRKGVINIRARLGLMEDLIEKELDTGTILGKYEFKVFFNKPEKAGPEINLRYEGNSNDYRRYWFDSKDRNGVVINTEHPEFKACGESAIEQEKYITRVYLRACISLYASKGMLDGNLLNGSTNANNMNNFEYFDALEQKIEEIWYQQCLKK